MKKTSCIFTLLLNCISCLSADIIETHHFSELISHCTHDTLIVLDIDDTLLITKQMLGCDEWFLDRIKHLKSNGTAPSEALDQAVSEWEAIRKLTDMEIVEPGTDALIKELQAQGYSIMGLTTQGLGLTSRTIKQLHANNFDLSTTAPIKKTHFISLEGHPNQLPGVLYHKGILFTTGTAKGEALFALCKENDFVPKRIVFINDKESHLADVEKTAQQYNVEFIGLRYAYSDARKAAFSPELADFQFTHSTIDHLISDQEAQDLMNHLQKALI